MSDEELSEMTDKLRMRYERRKNLDKLLPEAYAAISEASYRILGMRPYDVQILGAIAMHKGMLAQMNTGEGKTLCATMPLYLNALAGKSSILVTTNEYLANRDAMEMGPVYQFMKLTVASSVPSISDEHLSNEDKKEIYASDIVYTTHSVLGFDYLLNNLVKKASDRFMPEFHFIIIDEADSVLLDAAQTPLVISGSPRVQSNQYELADFFVTTLTEDEDYEIEEGQVWFTQEGIKKAETFYQIPNFYSEEYFDINRHVMLALRAHTLFENEKEYMVTGTEKDPKLILLDNGSGRMLPGVKLRGGQHQALEVKEHMEPSQETRSVASITYQNLFLLFPKMAGMSGTISDAAEELKNVYGIDVLEIPPNKPVKRKDYPDQFFNDIDSQFDAAISEVVEIHEKGQPVLIVVSNIAETELVSKVLISLKIPHNVLNANNAYWEAQIIKEAGQKYAVTVSTSMAGRGTDIKLGDGVKELGGLAVIGIGRMANIRQERQARGRAGRQGDPGFSRFYVSFDDESMKNLIPKKYLEHEKTYRKRTIKKVINRAQALAEERAISSRKQSLSYDMVLQKQRDMIYEMRNHLLDGDVVEKKTLMNIAKRTINDFLASQQDMDRDVLTRYILDNIAYHLDEDVTSIRSYKKRILRKYLLLKVEEGLLQQEELLKSKSRMDDFVRRATLQAIDDAWVEQVDYLQQLQTAVSGRTIAQKNPVFEYQSEALESFHKMEKIILKNIIRNILLSNVYVDEKNQLRIQLP